jgi:hypothetical protein
MQDLPRSFGKLYPTDNRVDIARATNVLEGVDEADGAIKLSRK